MDIIESALAYKTMCEKLNDVEPLLNEDNMDYILSVAKDGDEQWCVVIGSYGGTVSLSMIDDMIAWLQDVRDIEV